MQSLCLSQLFPRRRIALVLAASMSCAGAYAAERAVQESDVERLTVYGEKQNDTFGSKSGILLKALPQSVQLDEPWSAYVRGNDSSTRLLLTGSRWGSMASIFDEVLAKCAALMNVVSLLAASLKNGG